MDAQHFVFGNKQDISKQKRSIQVILFLCGFPNALDRTDDPVRTTCATEDLT